MCSYKLSDKLSTSIIAIIFFFVSVLTKIWHIEIATDNGTPIFDEKHYAPQAYQILKNGTFTEDNPGYNLIVHPPLGKWCIALGELFFGYTPLGWRFSSIIFGSITVILIFLLARKLMQSNLIGVFAGILALVDSVLFVASRVAMLDIFLTTFILGAVLAIVYDKNQMTTRFQKVALENRIHDSKYGPRLGFRWYRFTAGMLLGFACATKWSGIYFVLGLGLLSLSFDYINRKTFQTKSVLRGTLIRDFLPNLFSLILLPLVVFLLSYSFWFANETSVYHYYNQIFTTNIEMSWIPNIFHSFFEYQYRIFDFHRNLTNHAGFHHPGESKPWSWPMSLKPMLYHYQNINMQGTKYVSAVMLTGAPITWWLTVPIFIWGSIQFIVKKNWHWRIVIICYGIGWLPWFLYLDRQMYFFYATVIAPFLILAIALTLENILGIENSKRTLSNQKKVLPWLICLIFFILVIGNFIWLLPILTGDPISQARWQAELSILNWT